MPKGKKRSFYTSGPDEDRIQRLVGDQAGAFSEMMRDLIRLKERIDLGEIILLDLGDPARRKKFDYLLDDAHMSASDLLYKIFMQEYYAKTDKRGQRQMVGDIRAIVIAIAAQMNINPEAAIKADQPRKEEK